MDSSLSENTKETSIELLKKWHRSGFISFSLWNEFDKVIIEIGSTDPDNNNTLKNATKCFIPSFQFLAYLHAEVTNNLLHVFPNFEKGGISFFGGTTKPTVISRIFNSSYYTDYRNNNTIDFHHRTFTCAHYEGTVKDKGIVNPNFKAQLSKNTIKLSITDLAEMYQLLQMQMVTDNVIEEINQKN